MEFGILIGIIVVGLGLYMWNTRKRDEVSTKTESEPVPYKVEPPVAEPVKEEAKVVAESVITEVKSEPAAKPAKAKTTKAPKAVVKKGGTKKPRAAKV